MKLVISLIAILILTNNVLSIISQPSNSQTTANDSSTKIQQINNDSKEVANGDDLEPLNEGELEDEDQDDEEERGEEEEEDELEKDDSNDANDRVPHSQQTRRRRVLQSY